MTSKARAWSGFGMALVLLFAGTVYGDLHPQEMLAPAVISLSGLAIGLVTAYSLRRPR